MAERFYCPEASRGGVLVLQGDEARHLSRVRRVSLGETVELFDGEGLATSAEVVRIERDRVELRPVGSPLRDRRARRELTLATAVPKGDRFDWLVEKATELGVTRLVPLATARSVVDPRQTKLERLRRVVVEASKQCGRNSLMELESPRSWDDFFRENRPGTLMVAHPGGANLSRVASELGSERLSLVIGPEGGFNDSEIARALELGGRLVGLGQTLLRIETAGIVGAAILLNSGERFGEGDV